MKVKRKIIIQGNKNDMNKEMKDDVSIKPIERLSEASQKQGEECAEPKYQNDETKKTISNSDNSKSMIDLALELGLLTEQTRLELEKWDEVMKAKERRNEFLSHLSEERRIAEIMDYERHREIKPRNIQNKMIFFD